MPRSSKHKSSKHSSRDAPDYSDPEKDSTLSERKSREENGSTVTKKSGSVEKRKLDTKDNNVHYEERTSSKRRHKEKVEDNANDRWNGGDDEIGETSNKSKTSGEKSRRRDEVEGEDTKKSSCKDGKHRDSSSRRKIKEFEKERHREKDRKCREGKTDKLFDCEDHFGSKIVSGRTDLKAQDQLQSSSSENYSKKRSRLKREDGRKHQDNIDDTSDRAFTSGDDCLRDGNQKEEKCRDENRVDTEDANKHRGDKQGDDRPDKEHPTSVGKGISERKRKKTKLQENDHHKEHGHEPESEADGCHDHPCEYERSQEYDRGRDRHERDRDHYLFKDCRERRRSPDGQDDLSDSKSRIITAHPDIYTKVSRGRPDGDRTRSQRQPCSSLVQEENGNILDQKPQGFSSESSAKMEDDSLGEFKVERSSSIKASPQPLVERSSSAMDLERRYINQAGTSQSLEVEESSQWNNTRDFPASEADRILVDESHGTSKAELSFNNKINQKNSSFLPPSESRGGISSPKVFSLEENIAGRYKRGGATMGRGQQSNVWRGPNWPSPVFIPFQHGPPHGGFQSMMPQFPSQSLFAVMPSMKMSHSGTPYHMRPFGWQNMMDVSGPRMHGYFGDMNNGVFRDESRRRVDGRAWDSGADSWKTQNGNGSMDVSSMSVKDDHSPQALDCDTMEAGSKLTSPAKESAVCSPKILFEEAYVDAIVETMDTVERYCQHYLSKLDISVKLTDAELHSQCMGLLKGEQDIMSDDGIAVFVNLKEGGKAVSISHYSSMTSLIPTEDNSVFEIAMELYKEQRYETKGLPHFKYEGSQVSSSDMEGSQVSSSGSNPLRKEQEAKLPEPEREEEEEKGSSEAQEDKESGVIVRDDVSSKSLVSESDESVITRIHH